METKTLATETGAERHDMRWAMQNRLRAQAEALITAFEAIEAPATPVEAERSARALAAIAKVVATVWTDISEDQPYIDPEIVRAERRREGEARLAAIRGEPVPAV